ncbi:horcolin-like [Bidens hawaiensis]|uniref:horcolin-like n=1 Tax=Bidens hawaiensis TaxID=980011 RepID=UPI00404A06CF
MYNYKEYRNHIDKKMAQADIIQGGPWGGFGGDPWLVTTNGGRVYSIKIVSRTGGADSCITSLEFFYTDKDNVKHSSKKFGNLSGNAETLNFADDEDIVEVKGTFGALYHMTVITSLTFVTNKKVYGPFGRLTSNVLGSFETKGRFEGFFGRSGDVIDSLGAVLFPK